VFPLVGAEHRAHAALTQRLPPGHTGRRGPRPAR
jgi:hypothetical protein